jgi:hypothetical protein
LGSIFFSGRRSTPGISPATSHDERLISTTTVAEGHSKLEAIRCLKRYIAREVFTLISQRQRTIRQAQIAA